MLKTRVAIIGAGPAGIACAIQLKRSKIAFLIFEREKPGGLLRNANFVENYPGFPDGIKGEKLVALFQQQLQNNKINIIKESVERVKYEKTFLIETSKNIYQSEFLVVASGTKPRMLDLEIPQAANFRIFYEIIKIKKLKNSRIAIIGAGDAGFDYALSLSKKNKVWILDRAEKPKCLPSLFDKCMKNQRIVYLKNFAVTGVRFIDNNLILSSDNRTLSVDYMVVAIGREPNLDFLEQYTIKSLEGNKKLYMIGDVKNGPFRQTAIAVGDGIKAAMEISRMSLNYEGNQ
ncbi:MAG: NAD(P)/FAD-dependent oxidoreductase [candidate division WOR-3 bacterium]